jgi:hypothetical protein
METQEHLTLNIMEDSEYSDYRDDVSTLRIKTPKPKRPEIEGLEGCQKKCTGPTVFRQNHVPSRERCLKTGMKKDVLYLSMASFLVGLYLMGNGFYTQKGELLWLGAFIILAGVFFLSVGASV